MSSNAVNLFLPLDLRMLIQEDCAKSERLNATVILSILTEHYKTRLPQTVYEQLRDEYSKTAFEQRDAKRIKAQERERDKGDSEEKQRKRELVKLSQLIANAEFHLSQKDNSEQTKGYWERRLKEFKDKKTFLEKQEVRT